MTKHVIQLTKSDKLQDVIDNTIEQIYNRKIKGGQYVFTRAGKALKVLTLSDPFQTRVEQSYGESLNINHLLKPAIDKGLLRHSVQFEGEYDDIPVGDFQEAQYIVAKGKSMFEALPSAIRNKFEGNPEKFMAFVQNPENRPWLRKQGMLKGLDGLDKDGKATGYNPEKDIKEEAENASKNEGST
ncbi:internal scaffolding protein [Microviridae sp.]|nr:internal scaffolding protein [Microviridae sp.]